MHPPSLAQQPKGNSPKINKTKRTMGMGPRSNNASNGDQMGQRHRPAILQAHQFKIL
jgi:hypothetical protein